MKKQKDNNNSFYIVLGILSLIFFIYKNHKEIKLSQLETKTIIANNDIKNVGSNRDDISYRIWTLEYKCSFIINDAAGLAANWKNIDNIKKNDTLVIQFQADRLYDLSNKLADIPIYTLIQNGKPIYNIASYNNAKNTLEKRWNILSLIAGILFTLRGFEIISSKTAYILAGISAGTIITLRILNVFW